ncbi:MAG TPA: N-glycosylase/DNA lyase [Candidatus Krumholzibacteriaceae bacterium]|nr:N-glycosylase/DNA lyase [Candidatus Krumholzibacteriaceae bacterium]
MQSTLSDDPGIEAMAEKVRSLTRDPRVRKMVEDRMDEFRLVHEMDSQKWYEELVYCLLTAYSSALMGQRCVDALRGGALMDGSIQDVRGCLVEEGHRFANRRAEYVYDTRGLAPRIKGVIQGFDDPRDARGWLVENVKGLGWKEASHYLRNVGYFGLAIIDRHILSNMVEHGLITEEESRKGLTRRRYHAYEGVLEKVARRLGMTPGELDLYLWYRKTGKVLK